MTDRKRPGENPDRPGEYEERGRRGGRRGGRRRQAGVVGDEDGAVPGRQAGREGAGVRGRQVLDRARVRAEDRIAAAGGRVVIGPAVRAREDDHRHLDRDR